VEISSIVALAGFIAVCFLAAMTGALFRPGEWYERRRNPSWRPPNRLFAPVWTAPYLMMDFFNVVFRRSPALPDDGMIQPRIGGMAGAIGSAGEPTRSSRPIVQRSL